MNRKHLGIIALLFHFAIASSALATSRIYSGIDQLISTSDVIALVSIDESNEESMMKRSKIPPFGVPSPVRILKALKGEVSGTVVIHHMFGLDDSLFQQGPGEYLVFLKRKGKQYVPTDGWPSSKHIVDQQVAGWSDRHRFGEDFARLQTVIEYINARQ